MPFQIGVDVKKLVLNSIHNQLRNTGGFTWSGFDEAANWCLDNNYNLEEALKWEDRSIQGEDRYRRAIYTRWRRNLPYPSLVAFDAPERNVCALRRHSSGSPPSVASGSHAACSRGWLTARC